MTNSAHVFALFHESTQTWNSFKKGASVVVNEPQLRRRISQVLRLRDGESLILFNTHYVFLLQLITTTRSSLTLQIITVTPIKPLQPVLVCLCPLLEKEAWERALSWMTVTGVTAIQPIITRKTKRLTFKNHDFERSLRVMIAAAEQSKQYKIPELYHPKKLDELEEILGTCPGATKLLLNTKGTSLRSLVTSLTTVRSLFLCVGPEGDLVPEEYAILERMGFISLRLTPTILRSEDALGIGLGILRSLS